MSNRFAEISAAVRDRDHALPEEVREVASFAARNESSAAHAMVGDLIQLLDDTSEYELADAEVAYLRAIEIDPANGDAYASLGFFYDAVMDDPVRAKAYFEKAIDLGDTEAAEALAEMLAQFDD